VLDRQRRNGFGRTANRYDAFSLHIAKAGGQSRQHSPCGCDAIVFEIGY
jgi:hypothetical protein